jgi:hypothetical protein
MHGYVAGFVRECFKQQKCQVKLEISAKNIKGGGGKLDRMGTACVWQRQQESNRESYDEKRRNLATEKFCIWKTSKYISLPRLKAQMV